MSLTELLQIVLYTAFLSYLILYLRFFEKFPLNPRFIVIIFIAKIIAGMVYGYIYQKYYEGGDTWQYFKSSGTIVALLKKKEFSAFLQMLFGFNTRPPAESIRIYAFNVDYWNDMSAYLLVRFHALASLLSFRHYYVHVIFYNFLSLIGMLYLFRFFYEGMRDKKWMIVIVMFFFPSILFWSSGIHKDGFSIAALGLILYFTKEIFLFMPSVRAKKNFFDKNGQPETSLGRRKVAQNLFLWLLGCIVLTVLRNFWVMLLIPALISMVWVINFPGYKWLKFSVAYIIYFAITTNLNNINPEWDFLNLLVQKQNEFFGNSGQSQKVSIPLIIPSIPSVVAAIPAALANCMIRPLFSEAEGFLQWCAAFDNILVILILVVSIILSKRKFSNGEQMLIFLSLFFTFTLFVVIGITVPIIGALVRYKVAGVLFLLMFGVLIINPEKIRLFRSRLNSEL